MSLITQLAYTREPPVHVRVGSERFVTSLATLCQQPGSLLAALFTDPFPLQDEFSGEHVIPLEVTSGAAFAFILDYLRSGEWLPITDRDTLAEVRAACQALGLRIPTLPSEPATPLDAAGTAIGEVEIVAVDCERPPRGGTYQLHYALADLGRRGYRVVAQGHDCTQLHSPGMSLAHNKAVAASETRMAYETRQTLRVDPSVVLERVGRRHTALECVLKAPVDRGDGAWVRELLAL
jgi:hypothetical protein